MAGDYSASIPFFASNYVTSAGLSLMYAAVYYSCSSRSSVNTDTHYQTSSFFLPQNMFLICLIKSFGNDIIFGPMLTVSIKCLIWSIISDTDHRIIFSLNYLVP